MVLVSDVREHIENENYKNLNLSGILHWITKGFSTSCATLTGAYSCYNYNQNSGLKRFLNNGGGVSCSKLSDKPPFSGKL